mmetsp:Transcript_13236/g.13418  ORF Transcript_13236/g.13418 Transcript_13236/m.13418 type:complete len:96 (+) Transcript_13236:857-1144(+)
MGRRPSSWGARVAAVIKHKRKKMWKLVRRRSWRLTCDDAIVNRDDCIPMVGGRRRALRLDQPPTLTEMLTNEHHKPPEKCAAISHPAVNGGGGSK